MESKSPNDLVDNPEASKETENHNQKFAACLEKAEQYESDNKWAEAAEFYKQAVAMKPDDNSIHGKLGFCYSRNSQHNSAIEVFSNLSEREPFMARWPYMIGYQYYDKKEWQKAVQYFDKAISLRSNYIKALYRNGYARLQNGDPDGAESLLLRCIECWHKLDDAGKLNERSRYSDACFQLGKLYLEKSLTLKAEKWLKEAVNQDSNDEYKRYNLGKALLKNRKVPEALEEFRLADALHPHLDYLQDKLASTHLLVGDSEEAEKIYRSIPSHKRKPYIWCNYGVVLLQKDNPGEAIKALRNAVRFDNQNHRNHFYLGLAYLDTGDISLAVKELEFAAKLKLDKFGREYKEAQEKLQMIYQQYDKETIVSSRQHSTNDGLQSNAGRIESYKEQRGFGFIATENGERIFFHVSEVKNPEAIRVGCKADFERVESEKGPRAIKVMVVNS